MTRRIAAIAVVLAAAGCGGSQRPVHATTALLTDVRVAGTSVRFEFRTRPETVSIGYENAVPRECGSGRAKRVAGRAHVVARFTPAATADLSGPTLVRTYTGPRRVPGPGPVLEVVKICDFEADLGWAIGLPRSLPMHVSQREDTVTVSFG